MRWPRAITKGCGREKNNEKNGGLAINRRSKLNFMNDDMSRQLLQFSYYSRSCYCTVFTEYDLVFAGS